MKLSPGPYPFIDREYPLDEMQMVEAPSDLEKLFKEQSEINGIPLIRGEPVILTCRTEEFADARFLIWWPHDSERIHMLVPAGLAKGRA